MLNIPCSSYAVAEGISKALYNLMRPSHIRQPSDVGTYYCGFQEVAGVWYLRFPERMIVYIHTDANPNALDVYIRPFVNAAIITPDVLEGIRQSVRTNQGGFTNISELIPQFWLASAVSDNVLMSKTEIP